MTGPAVVNPYVYGRTTGIPSSLMVPLNDFETFRSSGTRTQFSLRVGYGFLF